MFAFIPASNLPLASPSYHPYDAFASHTQHRYIGNEPDVYAVDFDQFSRFDGLRQRSRVYDTAAIPSLPYGGQHRGPSVPFDISLANLAQALTEPSQPHAWNDPYSSVDSEAMLYDELIQRERALLAQRARDQACRQIRAARADLLSRHEERVRDALYAQAAQQAHDQAVRARAVQEAREHEGRIRAMEQELHRRTVANERLRAAQAVAYGNDAYLGPASLPQPQRLRAMQPTLGDVLERDWLHQLLGLRDEASLSAPAPLTESIAVQPCNLATPRCRVVMEQAACERAAGRAPNSMPQSQFARLAQSCRARASPATERVLQRDWLQQLLGLHDGNRTPTSAPAPLARPVGTSPLNTSTPPPAPSAPFTSAPARDLKGKAKAQGPAPSAADSVTLDDLLEGRLQTETDEEVRETLQALMASLMPDAPQFSTSYGPTLTSDPSSSKSGSGSSSKQTSAAFAAAQPGPSRADPATDTTGLRRTSLDSLRSLASSFRALESTFAFPPSLDFTPSRPASPVSAASSTPAADAKLPFTPNNAPLLQYEHALNALLTRLDAVESNGDDDVRRQRKELVREVERALEAMDRMVEARKVEVEVKEVQPAPEAIDVSSSDAPRAVDATPQALAPVVKTPDAIPAHAETPDADAFQEQPTPEPSTASALDALESVSSTADETAKVALQEAFAPAVDVSAARESPELLVGAAFDSADAYDVPSAVGTAEDSSIQPAFEVHTVNQVDAAPAEVHLKAGADVASDIASDMSSVPASDEDVPEGYGARSNSEEGSHPAEPIDTFLLPAATPSLLEPRRATPDEDAVMVGGAHSGDEEWSDIGA